MLLVELRKLAIKLSFFGVLFTHGIQFDRRVSANDFDAYALGPNDFC
jgi:hypothetical protein